MRFLNEHFKPQSIRLFRQNVIEKTIETTIAIGTPCVMSDDPAFFYLQRWRGIATRYAKNSASFLAAVQIR